MGPSIRIGSIFGVQIGLHSSWFVIFLILAYTMAAWSLPRIYPTWNEALYWIIGAAISVLFFGSVLAHELSHAVAAQHFGLKVRDITLFIFGGAASLEGDPQRPRDEALIAAAGPAMSLGLGAVLAVVSLVFDQPQLVAVAATLAFLNLTLGIFNLVPGFPMDGGRILHAILWKIRGDRNVATRNAAGVGRTFGYLLIAAGVFLIFQGDNLFNGVWLALIGWFLSNAAEATVAQMSIQRALDGIKVSDVMESDPPSVSPNESVADLVNERLIRGGHRSFLVRHDDGGLAGIVTLSDVRRTPRENWEAARVTDIMTRYAELATIGPDTGLEAALKLLQEREVNQLPVVTDEGRTVVGLLTRAGILRLIEARMRLGV
ncbi:MAG: M50 family metallopeptidase [Candidatus Limnocylindria bacterium]